MLPAGAGTRVVAVDVCVGGSVLCMMGQLKSTTHTGHHLRALNQTHPRVLLNSNGSGLTYNYIYDLHNRFFPSKVAVEFIGM